MKVSFVATFFNEEKSIERFLDSIFEQRKMPNEIILVDGGSKDKTVAIINAYKKKGRKKIVLINKKGNRSVGRNAGILKATGDVIAISDAGCILSKEWLNNIVKPFETSNVDVVAGYYKGLAKSLFQKCLIPYVLVMPDKIDKNNFLPASRSMAFRKTVWTKLKGFPKEFSHNEDYVFAKRIKYAGYKIVFARNAIVNWIPRDNFKQTFIMFFRFAFGDIEAGIIRPKVVLIFLRYCIGIIVFVAGIIFHSVSLFLLLLVGVFLYLCFSVVKNYRYVSDFRSIFIFPLLQLVADSAVISGSIIGAIKRV